MVNCLGSSEKLVRGNKASRNVSLASRNVTLVSGNVTLASGNVSMDPGNRSFLCTKYLDSQDPGSEFGRGQISCAAPCLDIILDTRALVPR